MMDDPIPTLAEIAKRFNRRLHRIVRTFSISVLQYGCNKGLMRWRSPH
jgi:hypothetical protein